MPTDLPAAALAAARAAAARRGFLRDGRAGLGNARGSRWVPARGKGRSGWSGPAPDSSDPQLLGSAASDLVGQRDWGSHLSIAALVHRWAQVAGDNMAAHSHPESLTDGELVIRAESTAWATQLRLLSPQILAAVVGAVGAGIVTRVTVRGPTAPSWNKGPLRVRGRGPRDTYG